MIIDNVVLVNTYVLDPSHIAPSRSDANSNGHFPINSNNGPTGTPRGFQLGGGAQFSAMGFNGAGMVGGLGMAGAGLPMFAGLPALAGFAGQPAMGMPGYTAGMGPMRTMTRPPAGAGFNGTQQRFPGPYTRNDGRGPPRVGGPGAVRTGGNGVGFAGEGGTGSMGPREAVAGRVLRSYEDLDADTGEGTGELNY